MYDGINVFKYSTGYSASGYYGINHSSNEAGTEFMHSLGGNHVYEQFTLVILSFKRHNLLRKSLEMLNGLPYLHSIIVVWNDPSPPPSDFKWPKLHVDIKVKLFVYLLVNLENFYSTNLINY